MKKAILAIVLAAMAGMPVPPSGGAENAAMERAAAEARERAEKHLLNRAEANLNGDDLYLFYTSEESEEFE